jgi:hypothetical protein
MLNTGNFQLLEKTHPGFSKELYHSSLKASPHHSVPSHPPPEAHYLFEMAMKLSAWDVHNVS